MIQYTKRLKMKNEEIITINTENSLALDEIQQYILGTLLFTPKYCIELQTKFVDIRVYKAGENQPSMKIFRMFSKLIDLPNTPEGVTEFSFQDEVNILRDGKMDIMRRCQVNFSVFLKKETYEFHAINERPRLLSSGLLKSIEVFNILSKIKGSQIYAGDFGFISNGEVWELQGTDKLTVPTSQIRSLIPWTEQ